MTAFSSRYTVLAPGVEIRAEVERKKSRFLTVLRRADSADEAQRFLDHLRRQHHTARHHCSAWVLGPDRRIQRANDDGEPSGTAGAPMLEALTKAQMPAGAENLSDVAAVVVRWFGGTLLGAGGLVSAYSDAVVAGLDHARQQKAFLTRQRMAVFSLPAPIAEAGRWENELRSAHITVLGTDYASSPGSAVLNLAVADEEEPILTLQARTASLSSGGAELTAAGVDWVDAP
ncbi:MAG: IMPACT family protein [Nesterenkonia sp.]